MGDISDNIQALLIAKLIGQISVEEDVYLLQCMRNDEGIKQEWQRLCDEFPQQRLSHLSEIEWLDSSTITATSQKRGRGTRMRPFTVAASILLIITLGATYYFENIKARYTSYDHSTVFEDKKVVKLKLSSGKLINLNAENDSICLHNTNLINANKTLTFTVWGNNTTAESKGVNELTVPVGMDFHMILNDKTEVWLNSATTIKFPFSFHGDFREIAVDGEAYFKVAENVLQPFKIHASNGVIQVLGTEFNVNSYDVNRVRIALVGGSVRFDAASGQGVTIKPGEEATYDIGKNIRIRAFDADEVLGWREGRYYFNNATLEQIVSILPRWFGVSVIIDSPTLRNERFTGMVNRNRPIKSFLDNLKRTMTIDFYYKDNVLHFR